MTTIRPRTGGINLEVRHIGGDGHALINVGPLPKPSRGGYVSEQSARYPVADLSVRVGCGVERGEEYRRADKAEAKLAETAAQRDEFEAEKDGAWAEVRRLTAHHGGCQAHGYLSLQPGELCPHQEAKNLLRAELEGGDRG